MSPVKPLNQCLAILISFMDSCQMTQSLLPDILGNSAILKKLSSSSVEMFNELFIIMWHVRRQVGDLSSGTHFLPLPHSCFISLLSFVFLLLPGLCYVHLLSSSHAWNGPEATLCLRGAYVSASSPFGWLVFWRHILTPQPTSPFSLPWWMVTVTNLSNFHRIHQHEVESSHSINLPIWGGFSFSSALSLVLQSTIALKGAKTEFNGSEWETEMLHAYSLESWFPNSKQEISLGLCIRGKEVRSGRALTGKETKSFCP